MSFDAIQAPKVYESDLGCTGFALKICSLWKKQDLFRMVSAYSREKENIVFRFFCTNKKVK